MQSFWNSWTPAVFIHNYIFANIFAVVLAVYCWCLWHECTPDLLCNKINVHISAVDHSTIFAWTEISWNKQKSTVVQVWKKTCLMFFFFLFTLRPYNKYNNRVVSVMLLLNVVQWRVTVLKNVACVLNVNVKCYSQHRWP